MIRLPAVLALLLASGCRSGEGSAADVDHGPNWARVTYNNGQVCVLKDWSFDYHAAYRPRDSKQGAYVVHHYSDRYLNEKDATLRIYDGAGRRLAIAPSDLQELRRTLECEPGAEGPPPEPFDPDEPGVLPKPRPKCRVLRTYLSAHGIGKISMTPVAPPARKKKARPNALVPAADHYWPEQFSGSHRDFQKVSVRLVGSPAEDCQYNTTLNLSVVETSAPTVERVELHAQPVAAARP